jgi:3-deoxy-manno-octulosonate cytidylyltransferase (CMP-KDO synthetase)
MDIIGVIPARYASSRFPGKPLAEIHGRPMIWWVYQTAKQVPELTEVYVATDDDRIRKAVEEFGGKAIMTRSDHLTGTDRVAEVAKKVLADSYCVIMGDEPLLTAKDISIAISKTKSSPNASAVMLVRKFDHLPDIVNNSTIKVALSADMRVVFMSRSAIPYPKENLDFSYYKNIGIYIFSRDILAFFKATPLGKLESIEGLEMLRLLEAGKYIVAVETANKSLAVDTPKDLERVQRIMPPPASFTSS